MRRAPLQAEAVAELSKADAVLAAVLLRLLALVEQQPALLADPAVLTGLVGALGADPTLAPEPTREPVNESSASRPVLSEALRGTLRAYFATSNAALADHLGRTLPW